MNVKMVVPSPSSRQCLSESALPLPDSWVYLAAVKKRRTKIHLGTNNPIRFLHIVFQAQRSVIMLLLPLLRTFYNKQGKVCLGLATMQLSSSLVYYVRRTNLRNSGMYG